MSQSKILLIMLALLSLLGQLFALPAAPLDGQEFTPTQTSVRQAIDKVTRRLLQEQHPDGHWEGKIIYNATEPAAYILLTEYLGVADKSWEAHAVEWLTTHRNPDGSWGVLVEDSIPDPTATALAILALEVAGMPEDSPIVEKGKAWIDAHGGIKAAGLLAQLFYAVYGKFPWEEIALPPIEMMLNAEAKRRLYDERSAWARDVLPAGMILSTLALHGENLTAPQQVALQAAETLLLENQAEDGSWGETAIPTFYVILALHKVNAEKNKTAISQGLSYLKSLVDDQGYVHRFRLLVWDTALAVLALCHPEQRTNPDVNEACVKARDWLVKAQTSSGGWSYVPNSERFADNDDTALVLAALSLFDGETVEVRDSLTRGVQALLTMQNQNNDGGWAAFAHNQGVKEPGPLPPVYRQPDVTFLDVSTADVVGHALLALGRTGHTVDNSEAVRKAVQFLVSDQMEDGKWYGRWGICYTYGTGAVLQGLEAVGEDMKKDYIQKAITWLREHQHGDGGWGESYLAFYEPEYAGVGFSTADQTAFALLGLLSAGEDPRSEVVANGVRYLLENQEEDGSWPDEYVLSGVNVYVDTIYGKVFPLWALSAYERALVEVHEGPLTRKDNLVLVIIGGAIFLAAGVAILHRVKTRASKPHSA